MLRTAGMHLPRRVNVDHPSRCMRLPVPTWQVHATQKQQRMLATRAASHLSSHSKALVEQWMGLDRDPASRDQVQRLFAAEDEGMLQELLGRRLEFGTAGLRGKMGPGFNRMNAVVVQQTSQGLCAYLEKQCPDVLQRHGVVVGFDGRHGSWEFAYITAAVFMSRGHPVHLFSHMVPTPFVAAGVAVLSAAAGVMVTASHNPKEYNGYKVYWGNGCQIIPPHDSGIAAAILANLQLWPLPDLSMLNSQNYENHDLLKDLSSHVTQVYFDRLCRELHFRSVAANAAASPVVYTPLHGVGAGPVKAAFKAFGLLPPIIVPEQADPNPEFPTVVFPNPEEGKGTWSLAFQAGEQHGARLLLANDPDADRLAVAEHDAGLPERWRTFSGNEIGILLADWVWVNYKRRHPEVAPGRCAMLASTVSSKMLGAMAAAEGFLFEETLTGFKWLGNRALELEQQGYQVLFAFEEAIGFMFGRLFKDKDGVSAAAVFAELAADLYSRGTSVAGHLAELYKRYGYFTYRASYFVVDQPEKSRAVFERLREGGNYAQTVAGLAVLSVRDLGCGVDTAQPDGKARLPWQAGDMMITYSLQENATLTLRASGTEPKLKYYLEVQDSDAASSAQLADRLVAAVAEELVQARQYGLQLPQQI